MSRRICNICQTKYDYCPHCSSDKNKPTWMFIFHNDNCFQIFDTLQKHSTKEYSDEKAIDLLEKCDLSALTNATETIKKQAKDILDKKEIKSVKVEAKKHYKNETVKKEVKQETKSNL